MMLMLKSTRFMIQIRMRDLQRGKGKGSVLMMKNHHIRFFVLILNLEMVLILGFLIDIIWLVHSFVY